MAGGLGFTWNGAPADAQFTSDAGQALTVDYNPAFFAGSGTQASYPTANPSTNASPSVSPVFDAASAAGAPLGTLPAVSPGYYSASPGVAGASSALGGSTMIWLLLAAGALLLLSGGGGGRRH